MHMDLQLLKTGVHFSHRKKKWLFAFAFFSVSTYSAYKVYNSPSVVDKRKRILKLLGAIISITETISDSAETIGIVTKDLKLFLKSDSNQIPNSFKQLSKIARSEEFSESAITVTEALTVTVFRRLKSTKNDSFGTFSEQVVNKMVSPEGTGFVSSVVGSFARNLVLGFCSSRQSGSEESSSPALAGLPGWVSVVSSEKCRGLMGDSIKTFVSTAVAVYLDKTMDNNFYDEMLSGLTNPKHQARVKEFLTSICNGAVETLVKTSHQVLTTPTHDRNSTIVDKMGEEFPEQASKLAEVKEKSMSINGEIQINGGWVSTVSSTLADPNNRRLVLDMTGKLTIETIRSLVELFLQKLSEWWRTSIGVVHEEMVDRWVKVIGAKSSIIFALLVVAIALYLHRMGGGSLVGSFCQLN